MSDHVIIWASGGPSVLRVLHPIRAVPAHPPAVMVGLGMQRTLRRMSPPIDGQTEHRTGVVAEPFEGDVRKVALPAEIGV